MLRFADILICLIILCFLLFSDVYAATYHVRTDGNDTICNGFTDAGVGDAPNCSFLTVQKGVNTATSAGDVVSIHTGSYSEFNTAASGSTINFITIQANGSDSIRIPSMIVKHNYIKITGITITSSSTWGSAGIELIGNNCIIYNNMLAGSGVARGGATIYGMGIHGNNNLIDHNTVDGESTVNTSFFIVFSVNGTHNTFSNNIIKNILNVERIWDAGGDDTSNMSSDYTIIRGNEAYNITWDGGGGVHPDIFQAVDHTTNTANNWLLEKNYFHDIDSQIGINELPVARSSGWIFRNNIFANITQRMMLSVPNIQIVNNTFFQVQSGDQNAIDYNTTSGLVLKNNIIIGGSKNSGFGMLNRTNDGTNTTSLSNNYYGLPMDRGYTARTNSTILGYGDANFINGGNPQFVAAYNNCILNACNFRLQASSPLINKGANLSAMWFGATDYDGTSRPQGSAWDIGAYEYVGVNRIPLPPSGIYIQ
jgi:hypothetical protein